jgi:hypothetical protein
MRTSHTAVLERNGTFTEDFFTEPYEAGWASEARWFVRTLDIGQQTQLRFVSQLSPDGLVWCDDDRYPPVESAETGLLTWPVHEFGQWVRLRATVDGTDAVAKLLVYLVLKS